MIYVSENDNIIATLSKITSSNFYIFLGDLPERVCQELFTTQCDKSCKVLVLVPKYQLRHFIRKIADICNEIGIEFSWQESKINIGKNEVIISDSVNFDSYSLSKIIVNVYNTGVPVFVYSVDKLYKVIIT